MRVEKDCSFTYIIGYNLKVHTRIIINNISHLFWVKKVAFVKTVKNSEG